MRKAFVILALLLLAGATVTKAALVVPSARADTAPDRWAIKLLAGTFVPAAGLEASTQTALASRAANALAQGADKIHLLLQLDYVPTEAQKALLAERGIELQTYVPNYAWMVAVPARDIAAIIKIPGVRWVGNWSAENKLHPYIKDDSWDEWAIHPTEDLVMVVVQLHADVSPDRGAELAEAHGGVGLPPVEGIHGLTVWIPKENLSALAGEEGVAWIEQGPPPLSPTNDGVRASMHVDEVQAAPYNLDGSGVRIFVFDAGTVRTTHDTFNSGAGSRVIMIDNMANLEDHPTHVAGTAAGDGDGGRGKGVAPAATVLSAEYERSGDTMLFWDNAGDIEADYGAARNSYEADLGTNSIGSNTASNNYDCAREGDYGASSSLLDGIVRGDNATVGSPVIMTWANGNERTGGVAYPGRCGSNYHTTAPPSCAKNPIHVGATNSDYDSMTAFSSWGPCDDDRLKPIVSAPGCELGRATGETFIYSSLATGDDQWGGGCGTSMSTPAVAGVVALMIQDWRAQGYGGVNDRPLPALVKAMLMHSANDLGQSGPDYVYGFGEVDAKAAVDLIRDGNPLGEAGPTNWGTDSVSQGVTDTFTVAVPMCTSELKVSLAWDDYAAAAFSAVALVNDLDLEVVAPDSTAYHPWVLGGLAAPHQPATTGVNTVDNQEQVWVATPAAGEWTIRVKGMAVPQGPQTYGLVYTTAAPTYESGGCAEQITNGGFEDGTGSWTLSGAQQVAAPSPGHGSSSLRLGGHIMTDHTAYQQLSIPTGQARAELSFWWYMTTNERKDGHGYDFFYADVRDTSDVVLATFDYRSDGWPEGQWQKSENMDLTPWVGQTVRIYFYAANDSRFSTTFWVDDVSLETCPSLPVTWVGDTTSWSAAGNWSSGVAPSCCTPVTIPTSPSGGDFPSVDGSAQVGDLTIASGAQVTMTANTLGVCGDLDVQGAGRFNGLGGTVIFQGSGEQAITMTAGANGQFHDLQAGDGSTSQTVTANSDLDVNGDLMIQQGATLAAGSNTLHVAGDWTDYGTTFDPGNSTVILDGTSQAVRKQNGLGWDGELVFHHLAVSGTAIFSGDLSVGGDLSIGGGMDVGTRTLAVTGTVTNSGLITQTKDVPSGSTTEFMRIQDAAGLTDKYLGVSISPSDDMGSTTVVIRGGQECATADPGTPMVDRCFQINPTNAETATIRFYYLDAELPSSLDVETMAAWHWNAGTSNWDQAGTSWARNDDTPYNWCEASGVNQYSEFGLGGDGSPTAVTLKATRSRAGWPAAWVPAVLVLSVALGGTALLRRRNRRA